MMEFLHWVAFGFGAAIGWVMCGTVVALLFGNKMTEDQKMQKLFEKWDAANRSYERIAEAIENCK